jgi:hypothetical protein
MTKILHYEEIVDINANDCFYDIIDKIYTFLNTLKLNREIVSFKKYAIKLKN